MRIAISLIGFLTLLVMGCADNSNPFDPFPTFSIGITNLTGHDGVTMEPHSVCNELTTRTLKNRERVSESCGDPIDGGEVRIRAYKTEVDSEGNVTWQYDETWSFNPPVGDELRSYSIELEIRPTGIFAIHY